jgi:hypothetical protein
MASARFTLTVLLLSLSAFWTGLAPGQTTIKDCLPVLAKDYYAYAYKNNLREDFLKTIDAESWEQLRRDNSFSVSGYGITTSDDYKSMDEKRNSYLEQVHYNRNQQQALEILRITTAERAYPAYEACLRSVDGGTGLRVWAHTETMDEIDLRVLYKNPASKPGAAAKMAMQGFVDNGLVKDAPPGRLWKGSKVWGVNQELSFRVSRKAGTPTTTITVVAEDGSAPAILSFKRADGMLSLTFPGVTDVPRQSRQASVNTPNNNENRGGCPNLIGRSDTGICKSRSTVSMTTTAPRFFANGRTDCIGGGCPWTTRLPIDISNNGLAIAAAIDNWGSAVTLVLVANEYEHLSEGQYCKGDGPIPVIFDSSVVFTAPKECLPIATIRWTLLPQGTGEGVIKFGEASSAGKVALDGKLLDAGSVTQGAFKLTR